MQSWRFGAGLLLTVVACAVQNNPPPDGGDDDDDVAGSSAGGKSAGAGKNAGGAQSSSGSSQGGTSGDGTGGDFEDHQGGSQSGGKGGAANGGSAGKASGGTNAGGGGAGTSGSGGKGGAGGSAGNGNGGSNAGGGGTASGGSAAGGGGSGGGGTCTPLLNGNLAGISARFEKEGDDEFALAGKLIIANAGPNTLNLADLKLRYYFTNEVTAALQKTINWCYYRPTAGGAQEDRTGKVSFDIVPMPCKPTGADTYLEFKFTADAGLLEPSKQIYFSWAVHNSASQKFTKTNDYSYDASATEASDFTKVVVLQNSGSRIWGTEP